MKNVESTEDVNALIEKLKKGERIGFDKSETAHEIIKLLNCCIEKEGIRNRWLMTTIKYDLRLTRNSVYPNGTIGNKLYIDMKKGLRSLSHFTTSTP